MNLSPSKTELPSGPLSIGTKLLVSVRDVHEAKLVWNSGVSVLDFKDPTLGSLGSAAPEVLESFVRWASGGDQPFHGQSTAISFSAGELSQQRQPLHECYPATVLDKATYVKLGMAGMRMHDWQNRWDWFYQGCQSVQPVMVHYVDVQSAESPDLDACLNHAAQNPNCQTLLLDTYAKDRDLFSQLTPRRLKRVVYEAGVLGVKVVVAGSITVDNLPDALGAEPYAIGVRGAVCIADRTSPICPSKLAAWSGKFGLQMVAGSREDDSASG